MGLQIPLSTTLFSGRCFRPLSNSYCGLHQTFPLLRPGCSLPRALSLAAAPGIDAATALRVPLPLYHGESPSVRCLQMGLSGHLKRWWDEEDEEDSDDLMEHLQSLCGSSRHATS
ncbi:hypothetical protein EJB05_26620, partial [Eragrostis curvula]